jgi:hypothetical protein
MIRGNLQLADDSFSFTFGEKCGFEFVENPSNFLNGQANAKP